MPVKNLDHDAVVAALIADGWTITDDPLTLKFAKRKIHIDLAAERLLIGAAKGTEKIAVEIQSFVAASDVKSLQEAVGQFIMYRTILETNEPDRVLIIAVDTETYAGILAEPLGELMRSACKMPIMVFDPARQKVMQWIK